MVTARATVALLFVAAVASDVFTQAPTALSGPTFDVVSVKRNLTNALGSDVTQRPDGGLTMLTSQP